MRSEATRRVILRESNSRLKVRISFLKKTMPARKAKAQ